MVVKTDLLRVRISLVNERKEGRASARDMKGQKKKQKSWKEQS